MDPMLASFLAVSDESAFEHALGEVLTRHATPIIRRIVAARLGASSDTDDVVSHVLLQLMLRLRQARHEHTIESIEAFESYVASAAHHACDHAIRRKHPARWRLRNRLRYVLEHDPAMAIWKDRDGTWLCGRGSWRGRADRATSPTLDAVSGERTPKELLSRLFDVSDAPLELTRVVDLAASAWQIPLVEVDDETEVERLRDPRPSADLEIDHHQQAVRAWTQICELPLRQRQALLLNLRGDALSLFVATGTASLRAIASALEMSAERLASFWNDLPMPDNDIAATLGCTRQQVINLRMAARKRLANRLAGWS
jgi:RNA polymerase sigma factor (sigma-70 family)